MQLVYIERAPHITALYKIQPCRAGDSLQYREAKWDPILICTRETYGLLAHSYRSDRAVPGSKEGGGEGNREV